MNRQLPLVLMLLSCSLSHAICQEQNPSEIATPKEWKLPGGPIENILSAEVSRDCRYLLLSVPTGPDDLLAIRAFALEGGVAVEQETPSIEHMPRLFCAALTGTGRILLIGETEDGGQPAFRLEIYDLPSRTLVASTEDIPEEPVHADVSAGGESAVVNDAIWDLEDLYLGRDIYPNALDGVQSCKIRGAVIFVESSGLLSGRRISIVTRSTQQLMWGRSLFYRNSYLSSDGKLLALWGVKDHTGKMLIIDTWTGRELGSVDWPFGDVDPSSVGVNDFAFWTESNLLIARKEERLSLIDDSGRTIVTESLFSPQSQVFMPRFASNPIIEVTNDKVVLWHPADGAPGEATTRRTNSSDMSSRQFQEAKTDTPLPRSTAANLTVLDVSTDEQVFLATIGGEYYVLNMHNRIGCTIKASTPIGFIPGTKIVVGKDRGVVTFVDGRSGQEILRRTISTEAISQIEFLPHGDRLLILSTDGIVSVVEGNFSNGFARSPHAAVVYEENVGELIASRADFRPSFDAFASSSDGETLAFSVLDLGVVAIVRNGVVVSRLSINDPVRQLGISSDGERAFCLFTNGSAKSWSTQDGKELLDFADSEGTTLCIEPIVLRRDGDHLAGFDMSTLTRLFRVPAEAQLEVNQGAEGADSIRCFRVEGGLLLAPARGINTLRVETSASRETQDD